MGGRPTSLCLTDACHLLLPQNIKAARAIFSRARKSKNCMPHVYVASALMEHYISKDPQVAGRIFELGLKNVPEGNNGDLLVAYISEYLDWLISQNDDNSELIV